ncbi:MAG: beta-lactamase family protein [Candidatus Eremiobacteraeota bacterium]|nr:beta-lactamase family protein [Candidatus Eremiobacteraeota bacterium]MBC5827525.1 beta-lactamase family protein [Candidatus Eremiobacteraeota bacterium]
MIGTPVCFARVTSLVAVVASLCSMSVAEASATPNDLAGFKVSLRRDLDAYLKDRSLAEHLSSLSLSVSLGRSQPTINVMAGTTKYRGGRPVAPTDLYQIGSNTKAFTAVAILQLEAQGRLSIDAPLGDYLPQYPAYRKLTLRRLLDMTSGLESYDNTAAWGRSYARAPAANVSSDALIRLVYPKMKYAPGSKYSYSNTGYLLAQEVVAARSKSKSYDAEIARIIASVGLRNTFYTSHLYPPAIARRVVAGYYENDDAGFGKCLGQDMSGYSLSWAQGAGSIVSTPEDLIAWARALYQGTSLLPPRQKKELLSLISVKTAKPLAAPTADDPAGFGLGVAARKDQLGSYWFYQGETLGFRAAHLYFPDFDLVVSLFANSRPVESKSDLHKLFIRIYSTIKARGKS